jgi:hypothetical protein
MIDGTDAYNLITDPENLIKNPFLTELLDTTVHNSDGVIKRGFAVYMGMKFNITYNKVRLQGSLHKYRNEGRHNYDDFTSSEVAKVVQELQERFEIDIYKTFLNNVEFGVNVVLPFGVHVVLDNLITYKGKHFERFVDKGISYYQCKLSKFIIKCYNKGKQYNLPDNVLRFEIKVTAMQYLETKGIKLRYLSDLLNMDIYEPLGNTLTEVFEEILFGDNTINESDLTTKELETYLRGSNPKTWKPQKGEKERKKLQRLENEFKGILERHHTGVNFRSMVSDLIRGKSLELSQISQNSKVEYNVLALGLFPYLPNEKGRFVPNINFIYNRHLRQCTNTKIKKCASCRKVLKDNQITYCSDKCKIEKDGRNGKSNNRNNFKKRFKKIVSTPSLFDVSEIVKLSEQQKQWISKT